MREDPDLDRDRCRQPEEGEQKRQARERRLRVLIEDDAAAMERIPRRELVEVDESDARRLPDSRKKSRIARAPEAVYGELARPQAARTEDHGWRGEDACDRDAREQAQKSGRPDRNGQASHGSHPSLASVGQRLSSYCIARIAARSRHRTTFDACNTR